MKKYLIIFLLCSATTLLFTAHFVFAVGTVIDEHSAALRLSEQLEENLETSPLNLKVRRLTLEGSQVSSEFASNLLMLISHELKSNKDDFPSVGELTRGLTRGGLTILPNPDDDPQAQDAFLEGTYRKVGEQVVVQLRLVAEDGTSVSRGEVSIPVSGVKHELLPPNLLLVQKVEKTAAQSEVPAPKDFAIELGLNKADGAIFREGEVLQIFFRSEEDCYLLLWYQDVVGNHYILYPETETQRKTKLKAGINHKLPKNFNLEVSCDPACGAEIVWAFASTKPIQMSGSVDDLHGSGLRGYPASVSLENILGQQRAIKRRTKKAEAMVYLTTVKK